MIAASFWSLLAPSIEIASAQGMPSWVPPTVGFLLGGVFLRLGDALLPHLHPGKERSQAEGVRTAWQRTTLLVLAITLHNVPEGLAVGVAFGAAASGIEVAGAGTLGVAIALTIGIGLQNFPEGVAISIPLRGGGMSRLRSFWYGQLSALVEPVAAVVGAAAVLTVRPLLLPYALAFAAGAMIYVVIEELIPESHREHSQRGSVDARCLGGLYSDDDSRRGAEVKRRRNSATTASPPRPSALGP
jgi:ZIP family zinc transporter